MREFSWKERYKFLAVLRRNREKSLRELFDIDFDPYPDRVFVQFWGTNASGKSVIPKNFKEKSEFVYEFGKFFTVLDHGIVFLGTHKEGRRTGGADRLNDSGFVRKLIRELWQKDDVSLILLDSYILQRPKNIRIFNNFLHIYRRKVIMYGCFPPLDIIEDRLFESRGKRFSDYSDGGGKEEGYWIKTKHRYAKKLFEKLPKEFELITIDTSQMSVESRFNSFIEEVLGWGIGIS